MSNSHKNLNGSKPEPKKKKHLGPVSNLEEFIPADWWNRIFNSLYLKTDGDVVEDQSITQDEISLFLEHLQLKQEDKVLDLCCGQGRHSLELARRGFKNIEGLDRSHYLMTKGKSRAKKENLVVKFREGDARKLPYNTDYFDAVMILGNSFGYFETINEDLRVLKEVFRTLKPWGKILIDISNGEFLKENYQKRSWEWMGRKLFVCRERSLSLDGNRLISRELITHLEKGIISDQFYAERLYTSENIKKILCEAGFSDINFLAQISPNSKRNQDLGMMENRFIISALVKKEWTPIRGKKKQEQKNIVVLMGDQSKPDSIKPSSVFDEDDFYTIDKLKEMLRELKPFKVSYLSKHDLLINDVIKMKPSIDLVFNLCDEGFNNDPKKELHIPALLELLNIPYTGTGPASLGLCYDKSMVHSIARSMNISVPESILIAPTDIAFELPFNFPVIVKPNMGDSSVGITQKSIANNYDELVNAISNVRERFNYTAHLLVEQFLTGMDLSIGMIGNPEDQFIILPIIEEDYSELPEGLPKICSYEAKWMPDSPYWKLKSKPAELNEEIKRIIEDWSIKLFSRLNLKDYARFDWRLDETGNPKLLEVNPNPGWCWDGHLAKMSKYADISYEQMLEAILNAAITRLRI